VSPKSLTGSPNLPPVRGEVGARQEGRLGKIDKENQDIIITI